MAVTKKAGMIYKKLGKSGPDVSVLSFGAMKWANEEDAFNSINHGLDLGMNYIDTSSGYIGGKSEQWIGKAIKKRRNEVYLSTKSNWKKGPDESLLRATLDKHLENTGLDYFDMYQIWNLESQEQLNDVLKRGGTWDGIKKAMNEGIIKEGLGFTYHGTPEVFKAAIDSGIFLSATVSYNLMNRKEEELINYAADNGVGIIVMNPLHGGLLGFGRNNKLSFLVENGRSPVHGSIRFLLANKNVTTSILGISTPEQVDEDFETLKGFDDLTEDYRQELIKKADAIDLTKEELCTSCNYCNNECKNGVKPSDLMSAVRDFKQYEIADDNYKQWLNNRWISLKNLNNCTECGLCEEKCPQKLPIISEIRKATEILKK